MPERCRVALDTGKVVALLDKRTRTKRRDLADAWARYSDGAEVGSFPGEGRSP